MNFKAVATTDPNKISKNHRKKDLKISNFCKKQWIIEISLNFFEKKSRKTYPK